MTDDRPGLSEETRDALLDEMFALHHALEPNAHVCFSGDDGDLIDAVHEMRGRTADLGDDR